MDNKVFLDEFLRFVESDDLPNPDDFLRHYTENKEVLRKVQSMSMQAVATVTRASPALARILLQCENEEEAKERLTIIMQLAATMLSSGLQIGGEVRQRMLERLES